MRQRALAAAVCSLGLLGLPALLAPPPVAAEEAAAPRARASAEETVKDFGRVLKGEKISHPFMIRNEGNDTLNITEVKSSCGCTVARFDRAIAAGESGSVTAEVDTTNLKGPIAKSVQVFTNDPDNPRITLVIKAIVSTAVEALPGWARFISVQGEGPQSSAQTVWSDDYPEMKVLKVESPYRHVKASFREATAEERRPEAKGRQWHIDLTLAADAPTGPLANFVVVHTDHPQQKSLKIPLSGFVRPVLTVTPRIADFGRREMAEPQTASLEIKNLGEKAVELRKVATDLDGLEAEVEAVEEGRLYKVVLTLQPGLPKGAFAGTLTIDTTSARLPVLEVRVRGVVL